MARTPHSQENQDFTNKAHLAARRQLYPKILGTDNLEFECFSVGNDTVRDKILDGELAIDLIVTAWYKWFQFPLSHTYQERFRPPEWAEKRDITLTVENNNSGLFSELTKLSAMWFIYGYYNGVTDDFIEVIIINVPALKSALASGRLKYTQKPNPRSNQDFIVIEFDDLINAGLVQFHFLSLEVPSFQSREKIITTGSSELELIQDDLRVLKESAHDIVREIRTIKSLIDALLGAIEGIKNLILQLSKMMPFKGKQKRSSGNGHSLPLLEQKQDD